MDTQFTIGCDPEYFLVHKASERLMSAIPFVKGTKDFPWPLPNGGFVMRDNVAIEFGIVPANNEEEWVHNINVTMSDLRDYIPDMLDLKIVPSAEFPEQQLVHPEAQEFGCSADFNAWTGEQNEVPEGAAEGTFRSCGGHIHIGYVAQSDYLFLLEKEGKSRVIKVMDCMHGMISSILDDSPAAIKRRTLYGKAGCFRPTSYGVEYRTLSNFWCQTDALKKLMYHLSADTLKVVLADKDDDLIELMGGPEIVQGIINNGDRRAAENNLNALEQFVSSSTVEAFEEALNV